MLRKTLGIFLITLLLAIAAIIVYLFTLQPKIEGNIVNSFLTSDTEVFFDDFGIPHIYADNAPDAYFALGYVHAQDRLFQMELMRRVGDGRLSEVLGSDMIEADILFRTIGINKLADRDIAIRAVAKGLDAQTPVHQVMSKNIRYCFDDESVQHVAENMAENELRRMPVLNREKRLVGVVSLGNIASSQNQQSSDTVLQGLTRAH